MKKKTQLWSNEKVWRRSVKKTSKEWHERNDDS